MASRSRPLTGMVSADFVYITSLRTTPEALLRLVRDRWSLESWCWIRDTQLREDHHRYRGNGAGLMATLRTAAMNLLRLAGFASTLGGVTTATPAQLDCTFREPWGRGGPLQIWSLAAGTMIKINRLSDEFFICLVLIACI